MCCILPVKLPCLPLFAILAIYSAGKFRPFLSWLPPRPVPAFSQALFLPLLWRLTNPKPGAWPRICGACPEAFRGRRAGKDKRPLAAKPSFLDEGPLAGFRFQLHPNISGIAGFLLINFLHPRRSACLNRGFTRISQISRITKSLNPINPSSDKSKGRYNQVSLTGSTWGKSLPLVLPSLSI
jgi:hypothetical protein